ncbi:MAG: 3'-5' exonuclease [Wenzhouxiangellaceae bacterium]
MSLTGYWRWRRLNRQRQAGASRDPALGERLPAPGTPVLGAPMLALDLEMTGLDPGRDEIVSIGWVPIDDGAIDLAGADEVRLLPGEERGVGDSATIHGIRDCDRQDGLTPAEALRGMTRALAGRVAVFHHAPLDTGFLDRALYREFGFGWLWPTLDTLAWFRNRQLRRGQDAAAENTALDAARAHYGLEARSAHNAFDDALSCAELALVLAARSRARLVDVCRLPRPGSHR